MSNIEKWLEQLLTYRRFGPEKEGAEKVVELSKLNDKPEEVEKVVEEMEARELEDDFSEQVNVAAYFISQAGFSYNDLCWLLAEKILKKTYKMGTPLSIKDTSDKAEEIFRNSLEYNELCWLVGEMDLIIRKFFDK